MIRASLRPLVCSTLLLAGCGDSGDQNSPPIPETPDTEGMGPGTVGIDTEGSDSGTGTGEVTGGSDTGTGGADDTTGGEPLNCDDVVCEGFGSCQIGENGQAFCACDEGYVLDGARTECIVDQSCVQLRYLENRCRQIFNGPAAVSLFFGLDFCAGTAVTPELFEELELEFRILENGVDITENVESEAEVIDKDVESYVTLVLDMSDSVAESEDLGELVARLRSMVEAIEPDGGDPPVYFSVYVFGRFVREYVPFTRDFGAVDDALGAIEDDPAAITDLVNGAGTSLFEAVEIGINRTQRIRELRDAVTRGGVLTTGTIVVVTDGMDSSAGDLPSNLIDNTLNQVISIGISGDVNDEDLTEIGRDGNFLAPTPDQWPIAFDTVAQRVAEYPDRAYLLAYCSSTTEGEPIVEVTVAGEGITVTETTACQFIAEAFSSDPGVTCSADVFTDECDVFECGGITACGSCADDECCNGAQCVGPVAIDTGGLSCAGTDMFCDATGEICIDGESAQDPDTCEPPDTSGGACEPGCDPGEAWCLLDDGDPVACQPAFPEGASCDEAAQCQSLNCQQTNPDNPFEVPTCQEGALLFDRCETATTVCEKGGYCTGNSCTPQRFSPQSCGQSFECRSGLCDDPVESNICVGTNMCYWSWDEKVPS